MKIAIVTSLFTKWYMNIYPGHLLSFLLNIEKKISFDFNSMLLSVSIIFLIIIYYKLNYPFFFRRYFNPKHIFYLGNKEDYFFRSKIFDLSNIIPLIIYSLIFSFFSIYVLEDSKNQVLKSIMDYNLFEKWIVFSFLILMFLILRILFLFFTFYFFNLTMKFKKVFSLNFVRLTINLTFINMALSYMLYEMLTFEIAYSFFIFMKAAIVLLKPLILYSNLIKSYIGLRRQILLIIIFSDFIPSLIFFDPIALLYFSDQILEYLNITKI